MQGKERSVFAVAFDAGFRDRVAAVGVGQKRRRAVEGELVNAGRELGRAIVELVPSDFFPQSPKARVFVSMGGMAAWPNAENVHGQTSVGKLEKSRNR